jgi:hypothetical protein
VRTADDDAAVQVLADHTFDLEQIALLPGAASDEIRGIAGTGAVTLTQIAPGQLRVTVESAAGGLLLLAENWMPGWQVESATCGADDAPCAADIWPTAELPYLTPVRADLTLVGVPVPTGTVTFDLVYRPDSVRNGLWIAGGTLALLVMLGMWAWLHRRRNAVSDR